MRYCQGLTDSEIQAALIIVKERVGWLETQTGRRMINVTRADMPEVWDRLGLELDPSRPFEPFGCYLFVYPEGTGKEPHTDCGRDNKAHTRLVACVQAAELGGELVVRGSIVTQAPGDAAVFRADEDQHEVRTIVQGVRISLTLGALAPLSNLCGVEFAP